MTPDEFLFIIFYILFVFCVVTPPTELVSAGLTVQNLFSDLLGSESRDFVGYHMRRSSLTLALHSLLPLGFFVGYPFRSNDFSSSWISLKNFNFLLSCGMLFSSLFSFFSVLLVYRWINSRWVAHPIAKRLSCLTLGEEGWRSVMSSINLEFMRFDKFSTGPASRRLIVTDTWLILTHTYTIQVARQTDTHLAIVGSERHDLHYERSTGVQVLTLLVTSADPRIKPFHIRLLASEYSDLRNKIQSPIINARGIVIQQSLSDQFLDAFRHQVMENHTYKLSNSQELENCVGCMQVHSNVKLKKCCLDNPGTPREGGGEWSSHTCQNCMCRPMWCLECMGKWFASRQDQTQPETWLSSKSPCPTCRAVFCMLDICQIVS